MLQSLRFDANSKRTIVLVAWYDSQCDGKAGGNGIIMT